MVELDMHNLHIPFIENFLDNTFSKPEIKRYFNSLERLRIQNKGI